MQLSQKLTKPMILSHIFRIPDLGMQDNGKQRNVME